jgi:DNA primase
MTTGGLLERWRDHPDSPHLQKLATAEMLATEDGALAELQGCLDRLEEERVRLRHEELFALAQAGTWMRSSAPSTAS